MSQTQLFKFTKSGNAKVFAEIPNAFRGAMAVWRTLEEKYLPHFTPSWATDKTKNYSRCSTGGTEIKEIWGLCNDDRLNDNEKNNPLINNG